MLLPTLGDAWVVLLGLTLRLRNRSKPSGREYMPLGVTEEKQNVMRLVLVARDD
jgi:hypothetical protein